MTIPEQPSDPEARVVVLRDGPAGYTDEGEGPVVVAVHGLPGSTRDYRWLGRVVEPRVRFIRLDMPGFGDTPLHTMAGTHVRERAVFVLQALDALRVDRFVVLGHSMGGPVAMHIAARAPDRAMGLALISSVGLRPHRLLRRRPTMTSLSRALRVPGGARLMLPVLRSSFQRAGFVHGVTDAAIVHTVHTVGALRFENVRDDVASIAAPSLVAWSRDDALVEDAVSTELAAALPRGPRLVFADGGHNPQKAHAVEIGSALAEFARDLSRAQRPRSTPN